VPGAPPSEGGPTPTPTVPSGSSGSSESQQALERQTALANSRERAARPAQATASAAAPAPAPVASARAVSAAPLPAAGASPEAANSGEVSRALEGWRAAWSRRDVDAYLGFYAPGFVPSIDGDRNAWKEKRRAVLGRAVDIAVDVTDLSVAMPDANHATTTFKQTYRSASYRDVVTKTLQWVRVGDRWLILRESSVTPVSGGQ
jgi:outer membrane protein, adhesin transport system